MCTIAEHAGDTDPHGHATPAHRAVWDTDGVRDDLRDYVSSHLGYSEAALVVDETAASVRSRGPTSNSIAPRTGSLVVRNSGNQSGQISSSSSASQRSTRSNVGPQGIEP